MTEFTDDAQLEHAADLRQASDVFMQRLDRLHELEVRKRELPPDEAEFVRLAREIEDLSRALLWSGSQQVELAEAVHHEAKANDVAVDQSIRDTPPRRDAVSSSPTGGRRSAGSRPPHQVPTRRPRPGQTPSDSATSTASITAPTPDDIGGLTADTIQGMSPTGSGRPLRVGVQLPEVERVVRWPEYVAMARAAEDAGFDTLWLGDHLLYRYADGSDARAVGGLDAALGDRGEHVADQARAARRRDRVPRAADAREARGDGRRGQRRAPDPRPRRGLERDRVRGIRLPVRPPRSRASRRRSRSSGRSCARAGSTSTAASSRPATAPCCRRRRGPAGRR